MVQFGFPSQSLFLIRKSNQNILAAVARLQLCPQCKTCFHCPHFSICSKNI